MLVAAYVELLVQTKAKPTVKQHLAALRMLFDWLVTGQVIESNPAASVRGPKHVVRKGKTHVLNANDARTLIDSIPLKIGPAPKPGELDNRPPSLIGLRDRALIALMVFSFARISAVLGMKVDDYLPQRQALVDSPPRKRREVSRSPGPSPRGTIPRRLHPGRENQG